MSALTNTDLEKLLAEAQARVTPIVETERDRPAAYLVIQPGTPVEEPTPQNPDARWLAVVRDDLGAGPAAFHELSLQRVTGRASHLAVVFDGGTSAAYRRFAGTATFLGRVLVVETSPALYAVWMRFWLEHSLRAPLLLLQEGRP